MALFWEILLKTLYFHEIETFLNTKNNKHNKYFLGKMLRVAEIKFLGLFFTVIQFIVLRK